MDQAGADARTRTGMGSARGALMLGPALLVVAGLFGGGLALGLMQGLGHIPAAGLTALTLSHFKHVLFDPDFFTSLGLTFYIAFFSTVIASCISVMAALFFHSLSGRSRIAYFIFQIPLTVPHLVIAVSVVFMLSPTGLLSRLFQTAGLIESSANFPLLINDRFCIGIMAAYVWKEVPFITLMIMAALAGAGGELIEVGRTLKAGPWQRFRYITLPIIFPALGAAGLIVFAYTFGAFEIPYLLGRTYPLTLPVWAYKSYSDVDLMARPEGIAAGIIIALVVTGCIVLSQALVQAARRRGTVI